MHFFPALVYPRKIKNSCAIYSHMCADLNMLTSYPAKGELSLTVRCAHRKINNNNFYLQLNHKSELMRNNRNSLQLVD